MPWNQALAHDHNRWRRMVYSSVYGHPQQLLGLRVKGVNFVVKFHLFKFMDLKMTEFYLPFYSLFWKLFICRLLDESFEEVIAIQRALRELAASADPLYSKQHEDFFIGFEGRLVTMDYFSQFCNIFCKVNFYF